MLSMMTIDWNEGLLQQRDNLVGETCLLQLDRRVSAVHNSRKTHSFKLSQY